MNKISREIDLYNSLCCDVIKINIPLINRHSKFELNVLISLNMGVASSISNFMFVNKNQERNVLI